MASRLKMLYVAIGVILAMFHLTSGAAYGIHPPGTHVIKILLTQQMSVCTRACSQ